MCINLALYTHRGHRNADQYRNRRRIVVSSHDSSRPVDQTSHGGRGFAAACPAAQTGRSPLGPRRIGMERRPGRNAARASVILVDSSVWIAQLRGLRTAATAKLAAAAARE